MSKSNLQIKPNLGSTIISVGNKNLDGSGVINSLLKSDLDGTAVKTISIKSLGETTQGMIRLFVNDGSNYYLFQEIPVPASVNTNVVPSFSAEINLAMQLKKGYELGVATEKSESFSVIADGVSYKNCEC